MTPEDEPKIEIKKGIPLPPPARSPLTNQYSVALRSMETGDCFDVPGQQTDTFRSDLHSKAKKAGIKLAIRQLGMDGDRFLRVWRIQ
jgi:hypothetical protein